MFVSQQMDIGVLNCGVQVAFHGIREPPLSGYSHRTRAGESRMVPWNVERPESKLLIQRTMMIAIVTAAIAWSADVMQPRSVSGQVAGPAPAPSKPATPPNSQQPKPATLPLTPSQTNQHPGAGAGGHAAASQPALPPDPPPIVFRPDFLDMGTVRPGEHTRGSVDVINTSDKTIVIQSSKASCTCTSVNLANTLIEPGQSVSLPAEFKGSNNLGPRKVSVRVMVEGFRDVAEVPMQVTIALPVHAEPPNITSFKDAATGQIPLSGVVTVFSEDHQPFHILSVQGGHPPFVDFDPAKDEVRDRYQLKWDLSAYDEKTCTNPQDVTMPLWIAVETDHPDCGVLDIEVRHECTRRTYLKPGDAWMLDDRRANIGRVKPGESVEITLGARWLPKSLHDQVPVLVTSESPQFRVEMTDIKPTEGGFEVHVKLTTNAAHRGLIYGNLRVHSQGQQWPVTVIGSAQE